MPQIKLPAEIKIPGVVWVVLITGIGIWAQYNLENPVLVQLIAAAVLVALRTLVDNDATLKDAVGVGTDLLNWIFRQPPRLPPPVSESGMRGTAEPVEPLPVQRMPKAPNAVVSWLFG